MPGRTVEELEDYLRYAEDFTVLRWLQDGRFTYAALKTNDQWYTTATERNKYIHLTMTHWDLAVALVAAGVEELEQAITWSRV